METGRAVAVASTNGVTALIAPSGEVLERAPLRETAVLRDDLPLAEEISPAVRWGTSAGGVALVLMLLGVAWGASRLRPVAPGRRRTLPGFWSGAACTGRTRRA